MSLGNTPSHLIIGTVKLWESNERAWNAKEKTLAFCWCRTAPVTKMFVIGSLMELNGVERMRRKHITLEPNLYTLRISTPTREWKNIGVVFVAVMFHHATVVSSTIFRHSTLISSEERVALIENHTNLNKKTARRLSNYSTCCRYYHQRKLLYNHNHIFFFTTTQRWFSRAAKDGP